MADEQRAAFLSFVRDVEAFLGGDELASNPAHAVAVLVRETAVAAFVRGAMWGDHPMPPDTEMFRMARETTRDMPDLYPAWHLLEENGEGS
jgi:hypothetical protein